MTTDPTDPNSLLILGEVRGQLREIIHRMNNRDAADAGVARQLAKLEQVPDQLAKIESRLIALETDKHRRDGVMGFGAWLIKTPFIAWVIAAGMTAFAYFEGSGK